MLELTEKGLKERQAQIVAKLGDCAYQRLAAQKTIEEADRKIASLEAAYEQTRLALADLGTDKTVNAATSAGTGVTENA